MFENGIDHLVTMPANVMISFPSLLNSPLVVVTILFPRVVLRMGGFQTVGVWA